MTDSQAVKKYNKVKELVSIATLFFDFILIFVFFNFNFSHQIKAFAETFSNQYYAVISLYIFILLVLIFLVHFPIQYYIAYYWEHKYGLSNQTFGKWVIDEIKKFVFSTLIMMILVLVIYACLHSFEHYWWLAISCFWISFFYVLMRLIPQVIIPFFYKYVPIENEELKQKIFKLFKDCHVSLKDIYAIELSSKTKKANAFVTGIGSKRRVVLTDNLLDNFTDEEIEVVVAHELGHYKHKDILKMFVLNSFCTILGFYLLSKVADIFLAMVKIESIDDITFFPILLGLFLIFNIILLPFINAYSRSVEVKADEYSLRTTNNPKGFITLMEKLAKINFAEKTAGRLKVILFYSHPPISRRIAFAEKFKK